MGSVYTCEVRNSYRDGDRSVSGGMQTVRSTARLTERQQATSRRHQFVQRMMSERSLRPEDMQSARTNRGSSSKNEIKLKAYQEIVGSLVTVRALCSCRLVVFVFCLSVSARGLTHVFSPCSGS